MDTATNADQSRIPMIARALVVQKYYAKATRVTLDLHLLSNAMAHAEKTALQPNTGETGGFDLRLDPEDVNWVVNSLGELGVRIGNQLFFCYKGQSLCYGNGSYTWRAVGKREFGETINARNFQWVPVGSSTFNIEDMGIPTYPMPEKSVANPALKVEAEHDLQKELEAALDALGTRAIRVREGSGPENLAASVAVTLQSLSSKLPKSDEDCVMPARAAGPNDLNRVKEAFTDLVTHRSSWSDVFDRAIKASKSEGDEDNASYYRHEKAALLRTLDALSGAVQVEEFHLWDLLNIFKASGDMR